MRKYFCNKCEKEMKHDSGNNSVEGYLHFGKERRKIWVEITAGTDEHFCKDCRIDAIKDLDYRPIRSTKLIPRISGDDLEDDLEDDTEGDNAPHVYVPPPKKKPGLYKSGGIVE